MKIITRTLLSLLLIAGADATGHCKAIFDDGKASFSVAFNGELCPYGEFAIFISPGETLSLEAVDQSATASFELLAASGTVRGGRERNWKWSAPDTPGLYPVKILRNSPTDSIVLNVFVMVPSSKIKEGVLNGYRIGSYPAKLFKNLPIYAPPVGFIELTPDNENTRVSPHFTLKQFVCKQASGYPKYLVLREQLLLKLEIILEELNRQGYRADSFHVMSGYRTPHYAKLLKRPEYSRHLWGGAADVFIDESPRDGHMDDLNRDGKSNWQDADIIYDIVDKLFARPVYTRFVGGLARYKKTSVHGPFVHVDVRGWRARWH